MSNLNPKNNLVNTHQLDNGLTILTKEVYSAPVASIYIWYRVGARNERPGLTGISHWVEHMLFKGTKKFPKENLKRVIEGNGGKWNGFTSMDYTAYYEVLPADKIEVGLALEADRMQNSIFDPEEVENERTVILSERAGAENSPRFVLREEVQAAAYKAHPYQWGIIGWDSDLKSMTRNDLYSYYQRYYIPNNATLVVVGNFKTDQLLQQIRKHYQDLTIGEPIDEPKTIEPPQRGERRVTVRKEGQLAYVAMAYHIPPAGADDLYSLDVLSTIICVGKTSRFYQELVDQQIATSAYLSPMFSKDAGLAWAMAEACANVSADQLEKKILEQIERIQNDLVTEEELNRAIRQTEAEFIFAMDSVSNQAAQIGYYETIISHTYLHTYLDRIRAVTRKQIRESAQKYFGANNRTIGHFIPLPTESSQLIMEEIISD